MSAVKELKKVRRQLSRAEDVSTDLRNKRNALMLQAITKEKVSEKAAAEAAGVSPAYAHRVKKGAGQPLSGPAWDESRKPTSRARRAPKKVPA